MLCITLIAFAAFIIVAVDAFHLEGDGSTGRASGTGGFLLLAESLGDSFEEQKLADVTIERPRGTARLALKFGPAADVDAIGAYIRKNYTVLEVTASSQGSMDL